MTETTTQPASARPFVERRSHVRYRCRRARPVQLIARPSLQSHSALIYDFSLNGIGILIGSAFPADTVLAIQLRGAQNGVSCVLTATVRHATRIADGRFLVGCQLSRSLSDDEVFALL